MKYLVIGATGNIGSRVTQRLIARGERPSVFARRAKKAKELFGEEVDPIPFNRWAEENAGAFQ
ncbi:MAG TPA: hypothetical protein VNO55_19510 [Polyangia bacterium]|nr:hypothetical protein [Polyangia bacterium]